MPQVPVQIAQILLDTDTNTATLELIGGTAPPGPVGVLQWYPGPGTRVSFTLPIKRAVEAPPSGMSVEEADGIIQYFGWEYRNGAWVKLGRINSDGTPFQG